MTTLALKHRPSVLADLVGQEASVKALTNALLRAKEAGGVIHHQAFLFAGVRGTGKTSTARILARALNCKEGPTPVPCGVCDACLAGEMPDRNLDIIEIDAASRSSVEDARALREQVQTRPAFCRYRVYIIDEVHMMSRSAFDALLKILEEPPAHAVFVLATTELQDVPDTIKSRVQIFPFRLIPVPVIESRLKHVCEQEGISWDDGSLRLLAEAGQGSMRDALTTLDRVVSAGSGHVSEDLVREQLGIVPAVSVQAVLEALVAGDAAGILDQCQLLASLGADWISFWRELILALRVRMEADLRRGAGPHDTLRWARMLQLLLQRERDLRDSSLPDVVVELALITAAQLPHLAPLDALLKAGGGASGPAPAGAPRPAPGSGWADPPPAAPRGTPVARAAQAPAPAQNVAAAPRAAQPAAAAISPAPAVRPAAPPAAPPPASPAPAVRPAASPAASPAPAVRPSTSPAASPAVPPIATPSPLSAPAPANAAPAQPRPELRPVQDPGDQEQLRKACSEALRLASGGLPRTLGALPRMVNRLTYRDGTLSWLFPPNVRNTVQDLEREQANPYLLEQLRQVLPGLVRLQISFEAEDRSRPEDALRADPAFQKLMTDVGGEIVEIRRSDSSPG
jgi:DNA polymerase-3 subunit gamma/tau